MEDRIEKDDLIGRLIQEEGLLSPSAGFTDRVMNLIGEEFQKAGTVYKPLISRKTWIFISLAIFVLLAACILRFASVGQAEPAYFDKIGSLADLFEGVLLAIPVDSGALWLATLVMASTGLLLFIDFMLQARSRQIAG